MPKPADWTKSYDCPCYRCGKSITAGQSYTYGPTGYYAGLYYHKDCRFDPSNPISRSTLNANAQQQVTVRLLADDPPGAPPTMRRFAPRTVTVSEPTGPTVPASRIVEPETVASAIATLTKPEPFKPEPAPEPKKPKPTGTTLGEHLWSEMRSYAERDGLGVDLDKVRALIDEAVREHRTVHKIHQIEIPDDAPITAPEGTVHPVLPGLIEDALGFRASGSRYMVWLYGPAGTGKSYMAHQIAEALDVGFHLLTLAPMSPPSDVKGFVDANGNFIPTPVYRAVTEGGILCIEEADNGNDGVLTSLNAALANGVATFAGGRQVETHKDFMVVCCANTVGEGGDAAYQRRKLDKAFLDRFQFVHVPYDKDLETALCIAANPDGRPWLEWCWF